MKLSDQAMGAIMMALQKSLLEQADIIPIIGNFKFRVEDSELWVENPPNFKISPAGCEFSENSETKSTTGSD